MDGVLVPSWPKRTKVAHMKVPSMYGGSHEATNRTREPFVPSVFVTPTTLQSLPACGERNFVYIRCIFMLARNLTIFRKTRSIKVYGVRGLMYDLKRPRILFTINVLTQTGKKRVETRVFQYVVHALVM